MAEKEEIGQAEEKVESQPAGKPIVSETKQESKSTAKILEKIREAKKSSRTRKFRQSWDISINLKNIDTKRPENRFNVEFMLPYGRGKDNKVVVIADSLAGEAKKLADLVIDKQELEALAMKKKMAKQIANDYDWFLGEVTLMAMIGKNLGAILGPRGKVPKPVPPKVKIEPFIMRAKKVVRVVLKDNPVIHVPVGTEDMEDERIAANAEALINFVKEKLPKGINNIRSVYVKTTMGKPVKIEV